MSLAEGSGGSSSPESMALGEVLSFFGSVADYAAGVTPDEGERIAALAAGVASLAGLSRRDADALYFAARLRNAGAFGNPAFAKGQALTERERMMALWDIPAAGARICERIAALPNEVADIIRWHSERWDGTGYPDQLRWSGIPKTAQMLHMAARYVEASDPAEGFAAISGESGRAFGPEHARTFIMWYHSFAGEIQNVELPYGALAADRTTPVQVIELLSNLVDAHNGTPGRAQRVAGRSQDIARSLQLSDDQVNEIDIASRLFAIGEVRSSGLEAAQFDALSRFGIATRVENALNAASLIEQFPRLAKIGNIMRARAEWYDGTGGPDELRHDAIPVGTRVISVAIAHDALEESYRSRVMEDRTTPIARIENVSGTQFDPKIVRALAGVLKAHA